MYIFIQLLCHCVTRTVRNCEELEMLVIKIQKREG